MATTSVHLCRTSDVGTRSWGDGGECQRLITHTIYIVIVSLAISPHEAIVHFHRGLENQMEDSGRPKNCPTIVHIDWALGPLVINIAKPYLTNYYFS